MSNYVVFLTSGSLHGFEPRGLTYHNSGAGFVMESFLEAASLASSMSGTFGALGNNSARYAVFALPDGVEVLSPADQDIFWAMPAIRSLPWFQEMQEVGPVFVPAGSEDLARARMWPDTCLLMPIAPEVRQAVLVAAHTDLAAMRKASLPSVAAASIHSPIRFEVRAGQQGTDRDLWPTVFECGSGKDAAAWAKAQRAIYAEAGKSLVVVKVDLSAKPAVDWRAREAGRMADGSYAPLPATWAARVAAAYPDHFAHIASSDKTKVAFTESESSGERDRQKVLSASAYASRFFDSYAEASAGRFWYSDERAAFVAAMLGDSVNVLFSPMGDVDALVSLYRECENWGLGSCMTHSLSNYSSDVHPVSVYAMGGEITPAFLRGLTDAERAEEGAGGSYDPSQVALWDDTSARMLARCLVWHGPNGQKEYGRVYGGSDSVRLLRTGLEAKGYRSGEFMGAKIGKVPHGRSGSSYVMPYLDCGEGHFNDDDDAKSYFRLGGDMAGQSTSGVVSGVERVTCDHCGDRHDADDVRPVLVGEDDSEDWCEACREDTFSCRHSGARVSDDCVARYHYTGARYSRRVAEWFVGPDGELPSYEVDGEFYQDALPCEDCGEAFRSCGLNVDGDDTVCDDCLEKREEAREAEASEAEGSEEAAANCALIAS